MRISVVIPTRERATVLASALRTVTSQDYADLEILVSDNCSRDGTRDVVESAGDPRIRYVNTGRRISMSENWEVALGRASGDWMTILGDDDGLLPGAIARVADLIARVDCKAIRSEQCSFSWPRASHPFGGLRVPLGHGHERRTSSTWLARLLDGTARETDLPMLYAGGFVHKSVLGALKARTGRIYHSSIPDIYSAVAIASVVPHYVFSHEPFAIAGVSAHSTGTSHWARETHRKDAPMSVFYSEGNLPFHESIPPTADGSYPPSLQAIVYESFMQSQFLRASGPVVSPRTQLEVILATAERHADAVEDWGRIFARAHSLDFGRIAVAARRKKLRRTVRTLPRRVRTSLDLHVVGSRQLVIENVYEASIAAAAVRANPPGALERLRGATQRLLRRGQ